MPPLNALRAFEAAARCGGFRAAAQELSVTPAAVSQHIRALEEWAGVPLFVRQSSGVRLSEEGARVQSAFRDAFDALGLAVAELRRSAPAGPVTIATLPAIAQLWLTPRLKAIRTALGARQVSVHALETAPNMLRDLYDISLFLGPAEGGSAKLGVVAAHDVIFPVCAPEIAHQITAPEDLAGQTLLHDASWMRDWRDWATACGVRLPNAEDGPRYSLYSLTLAEARSGAGVAMGHGFLVQDALADGSLVRPLPQDARTGRALILSLGPAFSAADAAAVTAVLTA
ncbi:LysR family transcriptional regulator [Rhodobacteraceae bacterium N5(2021)]|uniref:LysR family transcriptional regulator n=1 Tax=Gymnodinialimonas phycosphaerae TaxID=2841589 RepID=A0A975YGL9_9RHOB|nr:LysR family transcriptional regulator [Gymnodinialimonas phycosphaerae]MBY4891856.1 LysR family transcriptional regulator [Gymnodinialimonas phycosphaerae]